MKKIIILMICIFVTVACKTVKEVEEEKNDNVIDYGSFGATFDTTLVIEKVREVIRTGDVNVTIVEPTPERTQKVRQGVSSQCRKHSFVYPNPTSSSATININLHAVGINFPEVGFRYKLIFDERIIYESNNNAFKGNEAIPAHLLQNNGTYIVAYEIYIVQLEFTLCAATINFMVTGKQ